MASTAVMGARPSLAEDDLASRNNPVPNENASGNSDPDQGIRRRVSPTSSQVTVEDSPSVSQDMATIGVSNLSNLRMQMASTSNDAPNPAASNLSLRDMFTVPGEELTGSSKAGDDAFDQNEYFCDEGDYDAPSSASSHQGRARKASKDGTVTPPDSLHHQLGPKDVLSQGSSFVNISREAPRSYRPAAATAESHQNTPDGGDQSSFTPYSSDSSTGDEHWSKNRASSPGVQRQPVLYSAIGSLEDPSNSSFKWKHRNQIQKYEFPSGLLLPPGSTAKGSTTSKQTTAAITVMEPQNKNMSQQNQPPNAVNTVATERAQKEAAENQSTQNLPKNPSTKPSNLRSPRTAHKTDANGQKNAQGSKKVQIADEPRSSSKKKSKKPVEMFRPSSDAYTPRMGKREIKYKPAEMRTPVQKMSSGLGTLSRPNFRDALRRVAMIIQQHIVKIERRFEAKAHSSSATRGRASKSDKLFMPSMKDEFSEDRYITPTYKCTMVRVPMARAGCVYGLKRVRRHYEIPTEREIYDFAHRLFKTVQLSSECSIVCLIYVERLMEEGKVPLLANTWRPIVMTGLLLASKVWQDLSSWNIEFTNVYPQYSLEAVHRLEIKFLRILQWDLYISSSLYAKYYFALRALVEKPDFRQRYNRMVVGVDNVQVQEALKVEERSTLIKEEALLQLSRSM